MTAEQLAVARAHLDRHRDRFGFQTSNVRFLEGYIEQLGDLGLKPGGEMHFADCKTASGLNADRHGKPLRPRALRGKLRRRFTFGVMMRPIDLQMRKSRVRYKGTHSHD
jgi:hypothetical protein